ncbi:CHASE2 domain-containing protein [Phormidesmis sp. 146-35]
MWTMLKRQAWQWRGVLIAVPGVAGVVIGLRLTGLLQMLELAMLDQFFLMRPVEAIDSRIVIVEINESDVQKVGQWPMSDATLAQLITQIKQQKPSAIGLDIYRDLPVNPGASQLKRVFETTPNLVGVQKVAQSADSSPVAPPPILKKLDQVGSNDLPLDSDGKIRRGLLYLQDREGNDILSFGFKLAALHLQKQGIQPEMTADDRVKLGKAVFPLFQASDGGYVRAEDGGYQVLLNYRGQAQPFQTIAMTDVLNNQIPSALMHDRIVLIGGSAESLKDLFYTPYSSTFLSAPKRTPGVVIHANLVSQILSATLDDRPLIKTSDEAAEIVWIVSWSMLGAVLSWRQRHMMNQRSQAKTPWLASSVFLAGGGLVMGSYFAFLQGWWLPVVPPLLALGGSSIAVMAYVARMASEIRKTFGRYLTDQVVASLLENPEGLKIGGDRRKITILTSDLRGFTATSERLPPEEVVQILNVYLEAMTDVITFYQGTIDEFMGDGILVLFGAPTTRKDDAVRAVACSVAMQLAMAEVNEKLRQSGWSTYLEMGIGINTGEVVVGNIGSEKRTKYSVIGSHVNLTYRIESFTIGGQTLISESTFQEVESLVKINGVTQVQAKGVQHPISLYDVAGIGGKYNLSFAQHQEHFFALPAAIPIRYAPLEGKHINETLSKARLLQLSERGADVQFDESDMESFPTALSNLKLNLLMNDRPEIAAEDIYAKVVKTSPEAGKFHIRFTAKSPIVGQILDQLYRSISTPET